MAIKTKVDKQIDNVIKTYTKHEKAIKTLKDVIDIYNRNWEYLQDKHMEYTEDDLDWYEGSDIPSEAEALAAFRSIIKIK